MVGLDPHSSASLLGILLKLSARFQGKLELSRGARDAGLNLDAYISHKKYEQINPGSLNDTFQHDNQSVATWVGAEDIKSIYDDDDDHIEIQYWPNLEKTRNVEEGPAEHKQDGYNFLICTKQPEEKS